MCGYIIKHTYTNNVTTTVIDNIIPTKDIEYQTNNHASVRHILADPNMCMLNGRFDQLLDHFTTVSTKRSKLVEYSVISHEVNFLSNMFI